MSKHAYTIRTGDAPKIVDYIDGDLTKTGASVSFSMRPVVARGAITVDNQQATVHEYDGERDVTKVSYTLSSADTSSAGDYVAEFEASYDDGRIKSFPDDRYYFISVNEGVE